MMSKKQNGSQGDKKRRRDNGNDGYGSEKAFKWYVCAGDPVGVDKADNCTQEGYQDSHG